MTRIRTLAAAALLLPLSGAGLLVAATPAYAAGISSPGNGVTFSSDQTIHIRADISTTTRTELRLKSPVASSAEQVVDSGAGTLTNNNATLTYDLQTDCATYPSASCSGRAPAPNGTWTIRLTGGASGTSTFVLRIPLANIASDAHAPWKHGKLTEADPPDERRDAAEAPADAAEVRRLIVGLDADAEGRRECVEDARASKQVNERACARHGIRFVVLVAGHDHDGIRT